MSNRFVERELIAEGGMSVVVRAFDTERQLDVAVKLLTPRSTASAHDIAQLAEEARINEHLVHPHILPIYELGTDDRGATFLSMKLVIGETLERALNRAGPSRLDAEPLANLLDVFVRVCSAISFAHGRGILHRDLKPANVMVADFGHVYVLDWGLATRTSRGCVLADVRSSGVVPDRPGFLVGTPCYMAPEQLHGQHDRVDERTDVFGLGGVLYQILTGQPPHDRNSLTQIALQAARATVPPPEAVVEGRAVPSELSRIALKAMSHEPCDRYSSVDEMSQDVEIFQRGFGLLPQAGRRGR